MDESKKRHRLLIEGEHEGHHFTWDLSLRPSSRKPAPQVRCDSCPPYNPYDDEKDCWRCHGTKLMDDPTFHWEPEPPPELVAALRKVWKEHWNKQQNEKFELTPGEIS